MVNTNILLVDDDKDACASMSDILLDLGYTVNMAYDGSGALELSEWHQYRFGLLDYNMPGMDGLELCRRLKTSQRNIVVALLTGFSSIATRDAAAEAGVLHCLLKPVNCSNLRIGRKITSLVLAGRDRLNGGLTDFVRGGPCREALS